jgi:hypothetical protein
MYGYIASYIKKPDIYAPIFYDLNLFGYASLYSFCLFTIFNF